ncbi:MAG: hypothetical protein R2712_19920 [Vicinamibacterales bacterium]
MLRPAARRASAVLVLMAVCASGIPAAQSQPATPSIRLPRPTGPFAVGTTAFRLEDPSRPEPFAESPDARRVIEVVAWYPSIGGASGAAAPYLREGREEARTFARLMRLPDDALDYLADIRTWAIVDAPPRSEGRWPVLLFSHGYTAVASSYTALLEEIASHGYVVLSVVHPFEAVAAALADDRVATMLDAKGQVRTHIRDVLGEWASEDETMAAVTAARDENARLEILRKYLATLRRTGDVVDRWVIDTRLVLDRMPTLATGTAANLASRLDLGNVGALGHSMGGVVAAQFCSEDRRCRAAANLDGIPQYGSLVDTERTRPFLMVYSERPGRIGASDVIYQRSARPYVRVDVAGTGHLDFSDMVLWDGPLRDRPLFGTLAGEKAVAITRQIVVEFFERELRQRPAPLLSGRTEVPGVSVRSPSTR